MNAAKKEQWEKRRLEFSEKRAAAAALSAMPPGLTVAFGKPGASSGRLLYGVDLGVQGTDRTQFLVLQQRGGKTAAMNTIAEELRAQGRSVTVLEPAGDILNALSSVPSRAPEWTAPSSGNLLADLRNAKSVLAASIGLPVEKSSFRQSMLGSWPAEPRVTLEPDEVWGESPLRWASTMRFYETVGDYRENHRPVNWSTAAIAKAICNISPEIRRVTMLRTDWHFKLTVWGENGAPISDDIFQRVRQVLDRNRPAGVRITAGNAA